jgi:hypothetical protein
MRSAQLTPSCRHFNKPQCRWELTSRETQTLGLRRVFVNPLFVLTFLRVRHGAWQE